jgi:hypothetical protein
MQYDEWQQENNDKWNKILDDVRESGEINMFGAIGWLVDNYGLERSEASKIFNNWTETFGERHGVV